MGYYNNEDAGDLSAANSAGASEAFIEQFDPDIVTAIVKEYDETVQNWDDIDPVLAGSLAAIDKADELDSGLTEQNIYDILKHEGRVA